jgi:hypothetical protein
MTNDVVPTISAAVLSLSVVPVLPNVGCLTVAWAARAVAPLQLPVCERSPTGQRAASSAARATSAEMARLQRGLAAASFSPFCVLISWTGVGSQYMPSPARVA